MTTADPTTAQPTTAQPTAAQAMAAPTVAASPGDRAPARPAPLEIDRVLCSGHGVCAQLLPGLVTLDEWGYPILASEASAGAGLRDSDLRAAVAMCPARALRLPVSRR